MDRLKILIASGGSGGHIFPAAALARTLKERNRGVEIRFVGSSRALDRRIFEKEGFSFDLLSANKLSYKVSWRSAAFFLKLFFDLAKSFFIMFSYRPNAVIGFGGYVSAPVICAAYICGIPRLVHEQNVVPGRANRFLFKMADKVAVSFDETRRLMGPDIEKKATLTGNPIRREIFKDDRDLGINRLGLKKEKFTILVIGGSQGAHFLNEAFIACLSKIETDLLSSIQVIHITGIQDYEGAFEKYKALAGLESRVYSFIDRIEEAYSASDLIVSRSGASALFEIAFFGRPMILVPYPFAMSHQSENAKAFSSRGAAIEITESALSGDVFKETLSGLLRDKGRLKGLADAARRLSMPEASDNLARLVLELAR